MVADDEVILLAVMPVGGSQPGSIVSQNWQMNPPVSEALFHFQVPVGVAIVNGELPAGEADVN